MATSTPRPLAATPAGQSFTFTALVSAEAGLDTHRLAACCASVPGLAPVVGTLERIHDSAQRVSWGKSRCRKLSDKAIMLVFIICDHCDNERADTHELQNAIGQTVGEMHAIANDLNGWTEMSLLTSWWTRRDIDARINKHETILARLTESLSVAATAQAHDKVATLQASLKTTANNSADRKRAEDQLYLLRSAPPGQAADSTPPELACECVRFGSQPEYSGGRNDIWKGRWLDREDVALIFYREYKVGSRDDDAIRRFERQIRVWRKLDNPFILRLYGWCKFEGETYLVSPWLKNRDVVKYLGGARNRRLIGLSLIHEISQGLRYLHDQGIIHGSLKPSNILVQDDGHAVLSDFSLAKIATPEAKNTEDNLQINFYRYQAPEVILDQTISEASDVYSWAMAALEIITGNPPYHTWKSPGQFIPQIVTKKQIPTRSDYDSSVLGRYPEIWELFVRCWNREPVNQPTAGEIVEELEKILGPK